MRSSLDVNALTCLSKDDFWVLTAIEMAMRNHETIPSKLTQIMESNRQRREDHSRVTRTPEVIMHVLRLQRRQTLAFVERPPRRGNSESEDDDSKGEAYIKVF